MSPEILPGNPPNASVEIHPVMIPDDLAKAGGAIEQAVKKYA
jgi:hypothetical protein